MRDLLDESRTQRRRKDTMRKCTRQKTVAGVCNDDARADENNDDVPMVGDEHKCECGCVSVCAIRYITVYGRMCVSGSESVFTNDKTHRSIGILHVLRMYVMEFVRVIFQCCGKTFKLFATHKNGVPFKLCTFAHSR